MQGRLLGKRRFNALSKWPTEVASSRSSEPTSAQQGHIELRYDGIASSLVAWEGVRDSHVRTRMRPCEVHALRIFGAQVGAERRFGVPIAGPEVSLLTQGVGMIWKRSSKVRQRRDIA